MSAAGREYLLSSLEYDLGPVIMAALKDPEVVEVMVNPDGNIWVEKLGRPMYLAGRIALGKARLVVTSVASGLGTTVDLENPIVEGELPLDGSRFEGLLPPVVQDSSFTIRKKASRIFSLEDYAQAGTMPDFLVEVLKKSLTERLNILIAGGTGLGKTTLVNALILALSENCPDDRLVILEDTLELQSRSANSVFFRTSDFVDMTRLLKATMRYRPDRILVGEVRDGAALDLLKAWNTGHPGGLATVHANSAEEGLDRLEELVLEAGKGPKQKLIGRAVDLIVFIKRASGGRRIAQVLRVYGYQPQKQAYQTEVIFDEQSQSPGATGNGRDRPEESYQAGDGLPALTGSGGLAA